MQEVCHSLAVAGVRRRLRDVGSRVSGVLGALRDEVVPEILGGRPSRPAAQEPPAGPAPEPDVGDTGDVRSPTATAPDETDPAAATDEEAAPPLDEKAAAAVDLAREAARTEAGAAVGDHLGVEPEDPLTVTHSFATADPAYVGWRWAVTVTRAEGTDVVTVDEVVLLPGNGALLAPPWVPYSERVQPGDLGAGDLLPPAPDDPRLVPAYADPEAELAQELHWELGLGRPRVLSREGRADAAERWYEGDAGPASPRAVSAPGTCGGCGFLVPLGGALRQAFGACANANAPDDGRVVALNHGCGAHSETPVELTHVPVAEMVVDEVEYDFEEASAGPEPVADPAAPEASAGPDPAAPEASAGPEPAGPEPVADPVQLPDPLPDPADEDQAGELGHS